MRNISLPGRAVSVVFMAQSIGRAPGLGVSDSDDSGVRSASVGVEDCDSIEEESNRVALDYSVWTGLSAAAAAVTSDSGS